MQLVRWYDVENHGIRINRVSPDQRHVRKNVAIMVELDTLE